MDKGHLDATWTRQGDHLDGATFVMEHVWWMEEERAGITFTARIYFNIEHACWDALATSNGVIIFTAEYEEKWQAKKACENAIVRAIEIRRTS